MKASDLIALLDEQDTRNKLWLFSTPMLRVLFPRESDNSLNASLRPTVGRAVQSLKGELRGRGLSVEPLLMQSNGGLAMASEIEREAASTVMSGPVGGVRVSLIEGQWVAFPTHEQLEAAVFDMVVAGRTVSTPDGEDVAIMMLEAEATTAAWHLIKDDGKTAPPEEIVAQGLEAATPFICKNPRPNGWEEAGRMFAAPRRAKVKNMVMFNYRRVPAIALAKQMIADNLTSMTEIAEAVPPHCAPLVRAIALRRAGDWWQLAGQVAQKPKNHC